MKKIIRLTESDLHGIIERAVKRALREGVLGDNWHENENDVMNNYEPFEDQIDRYEAENEFRNQHDWSVQGEEEFDPSYYEDPSAYKDDIIHDPSDNELYNYDRW